MNEETDYVVRYVVQKRTTPGSPCAVVAKLSGDQVSVPHAVEPAGTTPGFECAVVATLSADQVSVPHAVESAGTTPDSTNVARVKYGGGANCDNNAKEADNGMFRFRTRDRTVIVIVSLSLKYCFINILL